MRNGAITLALLSSLLLLSGCTLWGEHPIQHWADATGGEGLERNFWKEVKAKNWNELERHIAGNYISFTPQEGRMDRDATLAHLQQAQLNDFSLGDFESELNGRTLVVTYSITMRGTFNGQPLPAAPVRMMTVWQEENAGWMAIAHTVIGPATQ
jgi:Domain of unknown function (DUF4440)